MNEYVPKMAELIQIYSDKTVLCPRACLHGPVFLDPYGPSLKALKVATVRALSWFFPSSTKYHLYAIHQSGPRSFTVPVCA